MKKVRSCDGTKIAFEQAGQGPAIIFVTGAFNDHTTCADLAKELEGDYTVITYDRRARGESGDTKPYAIEREVDDLNALIELAGGEAAVFGYSSGGVLALKAAADLAAITHLVLYDAPIAFDPADRGPVDLPRRLATLVEQERRADAVTLFQTEGIGLPEPVVAQIRQSPMFPVLEALAQSNVYDSTITTIYADPTAEMLAVKVPTLILNGIETWPKLATGARNLAAMMPAAQYREVPGGENHGISPADTANALREFLSRH